MCIFSCKTVIRSGYYDKNRETGHKAACLPFTINHKSKISKKCTLKRIYFHMDAIVTPRCNKNNHHNAALHSSMSAYRFHSFISFIASFMTYEFVIIIQDLILIRCCRFPRSIFLVAVNSRQCISDG